MLCAGIIGYRALRRSEIPVGGRLGLFGFGSSAHVVLQIALHRSCEVFVSTRGEGHRRLAKSMGASWTGGPLDLPPVPLDAAIVFAPAGEIVPAALRAVRKGGTVALAGIYMTPVPEMDYAACLFHEKNLRSVEANTRADGEDLVREAAEIPIRPKLTTFPLEQAGEALIALKEDRIDGTGSIKRTIFWMVALLAVYCSQLIFYNGVWPRANRYDFPGILYIPFTVYVLFTLAEEMIGSVRQIPVSRNVLQAIFGSALLLMVITKGYGGIVDQISEYVDATNRFTRSMKELSLVLEQNPDHALVLESTDLWQYEPVTSTQRFLRVYGAQPPMFLRLHCYSRETGRTVQERFLAADLERISSQGNALFLPLSRLEEYQDRCYSLNLSNYEFSPCADQVETFLKCRNNQ